jgi:hypothetical protein
MGLAAMKKAERLHDIDVATRQIDRILREAIAE